MKIMHIIAVKEIVLIGILQSSSACLFANGKGTLDEWIGFDRAPLGFIKIGEMAQRLAHIGMVRTKRLFEDGEGPMECRLGLARAAETSIRLPKVIQRLGNVGMTRAKRFLADGGASGPPPICTS